MPWRSAGTAFDSVALGLADGVAVGACVGLGLGVTVVSSGEHAARSRPTRSSTAYLIDSLPCQQSAEQPRRSRTPRPVRLTVAQPPAQVGTEQDVDEQVGIGMPEERHRADVRRDLGVVEIGSGT